MRVLISGSHGLIGSKVLEAFAADGHDVVRLVRGKAAATGEVAWDPVAGRLDARDLEGVDCVVHLAGENLTNARWSPDFKRRIRDSRVRDTRVLAGAIATMATPPRAFLCASAIGYYGDRGDEVLEEASRCGEGFLADVCREWEAATDPAREVARVVNMRIGVVLTSEGGAIRAMLPAFRKGLGAPMGGGRQYMSWIHRRDVVRAIRFLAEREEISGPVNLTSPAPVTNGELTAAINRRVLKPWTAPLAPLRWSLPAPVVRLMFGEMGRELFLSSTRVRPAVLESHGFTFEHADLESVLDACGV